MQQSSHLGNARREDRVPLHALIELRSEHSDEALTADGLDVSASGLAVRAAFVPEVGTRLLCDFRCPPEDDAVHAVGEVMWSAWDGPRAGSFGLRFLELDTKSATTIRRFIQPENMAAAEPELPRVAHMHIDGLGAPIEADVRLLEKDCIVLEQELSFLRLGRGIEVDVPGRGKERGRIASIELRQGPLDTPTLVFGVLLDEKPAAELEKPSTARAAVEPDLAFDGSEPLEMPGEPAASGSASVLPQAARIEAPSRIKDQPQVVRMNAAPSAPVASMSVGSAASVEDDPEEEALKNRTPEAIVWLRQASLALLVFVRTKLWPAVRALLARLKQGSSEAEDVSFAQRVLLPVARTRTLLAAQWTKLKKRSAGQRRTTAATPRVQRPATARVQQPRSEAPVAPRNRRFLTLGLALVGVGLGVYALAPRSGADRIRVRTREPEPTVVEAPVVTAPVESAPVVASIAPTVSAVEPALNAVGEPSSAATQAALTEAASGPSRFGESTVPNGRTFVLRMSGPVQSLEGEKREDGFTVRIPGRLALDRASPIASSHRAVARALILNRGEYAELTIEFLPGMRPKYQVAGKENTIEVTLERL